MSSTFQETEDNNIKSEKEPVSRVTFDISKSHARWTEPEIRDAIFLYREGKKFARIAVMLKRTELAVLNTLNLIRRALREKDITDTDNPYNYKGSYLDIYKKQRLKERKLYEIQRIKPQSLLKMETI